MELVTKLHGSNWIGLPDCLYQQLDVQKNQIVDFKKIFILEEIGAMILHLSAHNRYKLWINGKRITVGPCVGDPWRHYYESVDVSEYLIIGENIIAVEVAYYPPNQFMNDGSGGPVSIFTNVFGPWFILKGICEDSKGHQILDISTGVSDWFVHFSLAYRWKKYESTTYVVVGDFEDVSCKLIPKDWKTMPSLHAFERAKIHWRADGTYFGGLLPFTLEARPIPLLLNQRRNFQRTMPIYGDVEQIHFIGDEKLVLKANCTYVVELDAGELMTGYLNIRTEGGVGSKVKITYAESYSKASEGQYPLKGVRDDAEHYELSGYEDIYYPVEGEFVYEPFWFRTFRFIRVEVMVSDQSMVLYPPYYYETGYPLEVISKIETNEKWTSDLWDVSVRTLKRCMHETYYDCPYYEQLQYILDTRLEVLFTYAITDDLRLPLKAIEDFHASLLPDGQLMCRYPSASRHVIPVFSLQWIMMLQDYYEHTGDTSLIYKYRPAIDAIIAWFENKKGPLNLIEKFGHWHFVDWVEEWEDENGNANGTPGAAAYGPLTFDNLVYIKALKAAASMMELTGREDVAKEYLVNATELEIAVNTYCFDDKRGLYMDGPGFNEYSQHCQVWAVLSDVAKGNRQQEILKKSMDDLTIPQCSYAGSYFLFRALEKVGKYSDTLPLWEKWKRLLPLNLTTWPEDLTRQRSDCHGWGALPLYEFTRHILGVRAEVPGYESIIIEPCFVGLTYAKGQVITPKGIAWINWEKNKQNIKVTGYVPEGVPYKLVVEGKIVDHKLFGGKIDYDSRRMD